MVQLRSLGANTAVRRAQWRALGLSEADLEKPKIAVVNSSSELAICYAHLDGVAKVVKDAIREAGGVPFEVRTPAPALLDGMVCLPPCDKTPPGHLMAAGRLNIPTLLVIGGYQASGMIGDDHIDIEELFSGQVAARFGKPMQHPLKDMIGQAITG